MNLKRNERYKENKNLILLSLGKLISLFGTAIYTFAVGLYLLKTTGSGLTFAINIVLYTLPMVLINPVAGVVADKIDKKIVVVGSGFLNGIFLIGIYLLAGKIGLSITLLYISTFIMTVLAAFFNIGIESAKSPLHLFLIGAVFFTSFNLCFFTSNLGNEFIDVSNENMNSKKTKTATNY